MNITEIEDMSPEDVSNALKKWVRELRYAGHKKGARQIYNKNTNCFCVTGILCKYVLEIPEYYYMKPRNNAFAYDALHSFFKHLGNFNYWIIIGMNDGKNMSFPEIADRIEKIFVDYIYE